MMEPTPKPEAPKAPPTPEAKSAVSATPPKEKPAQKPETPPASTAARHTLEEIAAGKPVAEATNPAENLPPRETVTALLNEANALLLDIRDMRLLVTSLATQAADSPLGNEVRIDALRSLSAMETKGLPADQAAKIQALQEKIKALNIPAPAPAESATLSLITRYNEQYADAPIPAEVVDQVKTGKREASQVLSQMLQTNDNLAQMTWKELTGMDGFTKLTPTPENMLNLAGIELTPENLQKAQEIFGQAAQMTQEAPPAGFIDQAMPVLMYGALGIMFVSQIATGEQGGGGGHH